jgi:hypothetical protein
LSQITLAQPEPNIDWSELGLIWYGGPLALIQTQKNILKIRKIQKMREFFINEYGIYEIDSETEYRYGKQPISIYNSHGTRIPKSIVKAVKKHYKQGKNMEIRKDLEKIYPELKAYKFKNVYEIFQLLVKMNGHQAIDIDTEKFLPFYRAYNPISIKRLNEVCQSGRKAIDSLHPSLKPPMPIIFAIVGGIIGLAVIQNGPKYMREIGGYFDSFSSPAPAPPVAPVVDVVSLPESPNGTESTETITTPATETVVENGVEVISIPEPANFLLSLWNSIDPVQVISGLFSLI